MAIVFTKNIESQRLLFAFNNNIIRFNSTEPDALTAEINGFFFDELETLPILIILYPHPDGSFFFNLKDYSLLLANRNNYRDDLAYVPGTFIYDWTNKIYFQKSIEVKINFAEAINETTNLYTNFLSAYSQIDEIDLIPVAHVKLLSAFQKNQTPKLKYWKGYPFDFTLFNTTAPSIIEIYNTTNLTGFEIPNTDIINRILFSNGLNEIEIVQNTIAENLYEVNAINLIIETIIPSCGDKVYLKFINRFGGWNYWLFSRSKKVINPKSIGEINNDFNNVKDTVSQTFNMGVRSKGTISVDENINESYIKIITDLCESSKIYYFKGEPNTVSNIADWIEVTLKDKSIKVKDPKLSFCNVQFEIELPERITRTL